MGTVETAASLRHSPALGVSAPISWQVGNTLQLLTVSAGDPIELGAATSVLQPPKSNGQSHHLLLSAFKSEGGHAEPAAAVMGLLRLAAQVSMCSPHAASIAV